MTHVDPAQAQALAAIVGGGSFEAAAATLSITPSAVSQRIRALEVAVGRPVITRARPLRATDAGQAIVRFARQLELLTADLSDELAAEDQRSRQRITIVVNGDSLHTWVLPALAPIAETLQIEMLREDQDHSLDFLRSGAAAAAITSVAAPVQGCSSHPLGIMRYLPVSTRSFRRAWFPDGATPEALGKAPLIVFDRKDDLQDAYLRPRTRSAADAPRHHVPAAEEFAEAIRLGMGWGLVSELELHRDRGDLLPFDDDGHLDVPLHWQQWRHGSTALTAVGSAVRRGAALLRQPGTGRTEQ
ncbi:chromosome replication initiation inhibitor protein [Arthrobacter sp. Leaf234]|uniref:LysR family transcriptional regulator ArgP n=1 Tax=Arthrobacter sp. Leaf234 TaxID=1736303 RepID=UPI0006FDD28B|nr:LysR family transcriptional regulator ArgP [Arthrobacter sp. Leaf234]KQO03511.1 chromosome replication initiation inhibitor protein [Arthrobacter sp. Leaf234]